MKFKSDIEIQAGVEAGGSTGSNGQVLSSTGSGVAWIDQSAVSADSAESVHISVKNTSGAQILKGTPVYVTGETGNSGKIEIAPADASDSAKMPALGLLESTLANNGEGFCVQGGLLEGLATATIDGTSTTANDTVYVKSGGGLTMTKPTGTGLIQNIAKVARVHASNGSLVVSSILRTNDVPNLPTGRIWVGDGNTIVSDTVYIDEPNNRVGIGTTAPEAKLEIKKGSSGLTSVNSQADALFLQSSSSTGITIATPDANKSSIFFSSASRQIGARINWSYDDLLMTLGTATANASLALKSGNESEAVRILSNGNVGIGTASPSELLHLESTEPLIRLDDTNSGLHYIFGQDGDGFKFTTNNSTYGKYTFDGSVGIGTTSPTRKLNVNGNVGINNQLLLDSANYGEHLAIRRGVYGYDTIVTGARIDYSPTASTNTFKFLADLQTTGQLNVTGNAIVNGNVGIGTTSPDARLEVVGSYAAVPLKVLRHGDYGNVINIGRNGVSETANIGYPADSTINLSTAGSERVRINATGNVGIGTTSPQSKLHIADSTLSLLKVQETSGNTGASAGALFKTSPNTGNSYFKGGILYEDTGNANVIGKLHLVNRVSADTTNAGVGDAKLTIDTVGNVGIGTTSPGYRFTAHGSSTDSEIVASFGSANDANEYTAIGLSGFIASNGATKAGLALKRTATYGTGELHFLNNNTLDNSDMNLSDSKMMINSSGNVGIGTSSPSQRLDVRSGSFNSSVAQFTGANDGRGLLISTFSRASNDDSVNYNAQYSGLGVQTWSINNSEKMRLDQNGNVGIGTPTPTTPLHIRANEPSIRLQDITSADNHYLTGNNGELRVQSSGFITMRPGAAVSTTFLANGNVGIGTTSPVFPLHVDTSNDIVGYFKSTDNKASIIIADNDTTGYVSAENDRVSIGYGSGASTANITIVNGSYNVGIGTTSPARKLEVYNGSSSMISQFRSGSGTSSFICFANTESIADQVRIGSISTNLVLSTNYTERMRIDSSGNVGIGTTAPSQKLHVAGNMRLQNQLYDSTNSTGSNGEVLTKVSAGTEWKPPAVTSQAASLYDLIPNGSFTTTYAFTSTAGTWAEVMEGNDIITATGTYSVQVFVDDQSVGGTQYDEYYSGTMSWVTSSTNDAGGGAISEIALHRAGHAANSGVIYLRTRETRSEEANKLKLEVMSNKTYTGASNLVFKFVRLI